MCQIRLLEQGEFNCWNNKWVTNDTVISGDIYLQRNIKDVSVMKKVYCGVFRNVFRVTVLLYFKFIFSYSAIQPQV